MKKKEKYEKSMKKKEKYEKSKEKCEPKLEFPEGWGVQTKTTLKWGRVWMFSGTTHSIVHRLLNQQMVARQDYGKIKKYNFFDWLGLSI